MQKISFSEAIEVLSDKEPKYDREAYTFLHEALEYTVKKLKNAKVISSHHVDATQLLEGVREYAIREYGPMAYTLFDFWGIRTTGDIGQMVFNLIEIGVFGKTETDTIQDFENGYDFHDAFVKPYLPDKPRQHATHLTPPSIKKLQPNNFKSQCF